MFTKFLTKKYFLIFLLAFFLNGLSLVKDYGFSWDNGIHRLMGFVNLKYISLIFYPDLEKKFPRSKNIPDFNEHPKYNLYGSIFTLPVAIIEIIFEITNNDKSSDNNENVYYLSCYIIFFIYCISLLILFKTFLFLTKKNILSFLGILCFISSPRIFAESFYNISDIFLLCLVIFTNYFFLKFLSKNKVKNLLLATLFCAFSIITKPTAGSIAISFIMIFFISFIIKKYTFKLFFSNSIKFFLLITIFYVIFFPFLWSNPIENFFILIERLTNFGWHGDIFFFGELIKGMNAPWYYQIVMFVLTTPGYYVIFFVMLFTYYICSHAKSKKNVYMYYLFINLILIFLLSSIFQNTKYNGWRHIYFVYPFFISIIIIMINKLNIEFQNKNIYVCAIILLILSVVHNTFWIINNHPNQYAYFNNFIKDNHKKFDIDWWGISNKQVFNYLDQIDKRDKVYIYSDGPSLRSTLVRMNQSVKDKIFITKKIIESNYIITNFISDKDFEKKFIKIHEIKTDQSIISTIYKVK